MTENRAKRILDAYKALRKVLLTAFIIPIELPELQGGNFRAGDSRRAAVHARTILRDMPAEWHRRDMVDSLILEWLEAVVMARLHAGHGEQWYGDIADHALSRFQATLEVLRYEEE